MEDIGFLGGGALAAAGRLAALCGAAFLGRPVRRCWEGHAEHWLHARSDCPTQRTKADQGARLHRCPHGIAQPIVAVTARGNRDCGCAGAVWWLRRVVFGS